MTYKLIKTDNYLLVVDDSEIKEGDWLYGYRNNNTFRANKLAHLYIHSKKIIAHLPLNNSPILDGVDLLPINDDVEELYNESWMKKYVPYNSDIGSSFREGYNKAREKYKYTDNDIDELMYWTARVVVSECANGFWYDNIEEIIKNKMHSIQRYPIEFESVDETTKSEVFYNNDIPYSQPKTTTNTHGQRVWVGKYK